MSNRPKQFNKDTLKNIFTTSLQKVTEILDLCRFHSYKMRHEGNRHFRNTKKYDLVVLDWYIEQFEITSSAAIIRGESSPMWVS